ncbi:MAG: YcgL domain-containing protein [Halioglobus sp.]
MKLICQVYRSPRKEEMYLYVEKSKGLVDVPEPLLVRFGEPEEAMVLLLTPDKKLARANVIEVLERIAEEGFYLQMPPTHAQLLHRDGNEH